MAMSRSLVFCEECRNEVDYKIVDKEMEDSLKGETYHYMGKEAYCIECGVQVYVAKVNDYNLKALYDTFRKQKNIVAIETIQAIPDKYGIGKRPLSLLLGWGEHTFSRYLEGDMPTKQYSDILQKIYDEPAYYRTILERNKSNLKNPTTYNKSKRAVDALLGNSGKEMTKMELVIEYLLNQCEDITPLALQKALYYVQGFYYAFNSDFLFSEDCEAWLHGPVYRDIFAKYRDYKYDPIDGAKQFDATVFSSSEKAILDSIVKHICCYSGKVLENFTHVEEPWLETRGDLAENVSSDRVISKELIGKYFSLVKENYMMINSNDIKKYSQNMFQQI